MTDELRALLNAAQAADDAFSAALVAAYGAEHAREMRYFFAHPAHPEIERAAEAYRTASDAWLAAYRAANAHAIGRGVEQPELTADQALSRIHAMMDGTEWDSETMNGIALILRQAGYDIREPDDDEDHDENEFRR